MYVGIVNGGSAVRYNQIKNLSFVPEVDLTGTALPVNQFEVDIMTEDTIRTGTDAFLYDDRNLLWAKYWITFAEETETRTVHIKAQSKVVLLERRKLPAVMYVDTVENILPDILGSYLQNEVYVDFSLTTKYIRGYCPEQTARERLLWICLVIGAYVKDFGENIIRILPIDRTVQEVPIEKTFWKPMLEFNSPVSQIRVKGYWYSLGNPQTKDKWVEVDGDTYIQTEQEYVLGNPDWDNTQPENVVSIDNVTIINEWNVSDILSHLSNYYFNRNYAEVDVINNRDYLPGEKLSCYTDEESIVTGFAESCNFKFGLQARSTIKLIAVELTTTSGLRIIYMGTTHEGNVMKIGQRDFHFPVGYEYTITNPYIRLSVQQYDYIFRPVNATVSGIMAEGVTRTEQCEAALVHELETRTLLIISVDSVTVEERETSDETYNVAVIA